MRWWLMTLVLPGLLGPGSLRAEPFDEGRAGFSVTVSGERNPYQVLAVFVLPGETIRIEAHPGEDAGPYRCLDPGGRPLLPDGTRRWAWTAPADPGLHPLEVKGVRDAITLQVFVLVPFSEIRKERIGGYRIGSYPNRPLKGLAIYKPPRGFIEVTPENRDTPVSPHFTLGQFLCKQESGYPKYLVLRERLLLKLELLLARANEAGYRCDTFHVMSGYRTPFYNRAIGNVKYSRHVWGGAADIFIDADGNGTMDDLNRDGRVDYRDAGVLYDLIDDLFGKSFYERFVGGLGRYKKTSAHGPFVHVDVRGFRARWGT